MKIILRLLEICIWKTLLTSLKLIFASVNKSCPKGFRRVKTNEVLDLLIISLKVKVMLLGRENSKYVATEVPCMGNVRPKSFINPQPNWTNSKCRSTRNKIY